MNTLAVSGLNVVYHTEEGSIHALRDVNLQIPDNRIVGIVGESGCGKSTLINAVLGLLSDNASVTAGRAVFEGEHDLLSLQPDELRKFRGVRISTVFQDPMGALNPVISVGKQMLNIQYRSGLSKSQKYARSIEMLRQVRIPDAESALERYPHQFSGGMKQRIAIAMALMMQPSLLIADEPTTALDATLEVAIIELLKELQAQIKCSVLFISHHLGVVAELCDDVLVMYAGEVIEFGSVREIFHDPRHPYTRKLLECDPARQSGRTRKLPTIPGELPDLRGKLDGCVFLNRCELSHEGCSAPQVETELGGSRFVKCNLERSRVSHSEAP